MFNFNNDYSEGAHPHILNAMLETNLIQHQGYGTDEHTKRAVEYLKKELSNQDCDIHLIPGGTQTNLLVISSSLRPHQAVIAAHTGHINVHETGAIEATGHKVLTIQTPDGKLTPSLIQTIKNHHTDEHMVQPKMVYISNATEVGTQYTKTELEALYHTCRLHGLYLFLDGARLGCALTSPSNDLTLTDIAMLTDAFYIGGTKNGALFGEALILTNPELKPDFRFLMKQRGTLLAKGWLLGIQFEQLFQNGLFYDLSTHANEMASLLQAGIKECGYNFAYSSTTNQLFPIFPDDLVEKLSTQCLFSTLEKTDESHTTIRLVTSWATKPEAVSSFLSTLKKQTRDRGGA